MAKHIFILNGSGGVGKDTFANFCKKHCRAYHCSIITVVKTLARGMGWNGAKTEKDRKFLADLCDLMTNYNDLPFGSLRETVDRFLGEKRKDFLFIDIRKPDEIARAVKEFGAKTILITNDRVADIKSNIADSSVYDYDYDYIIENNGTLEDLEKSAIEFINGVVSESIYKESEKGVV